MIAFFYPVMMGLSLIFIYSGFLQKIPCSFLNFEKTTNAVLQSKVKNVPTCFWGVVGREEEFSIRLSQLIQQETTGEIADYILRIK